MTRSDRPRQFLDALAGPDGTQALTIRYVAPPVYPDASLGASPQVGRAAAAPVEIRIDPKVAAAIELAAQQRARAVQMEIDRAASRAAANRAAAARGPKVPRPPATVAQPYGMATGPSRQQAASAGFYQGPVPDAVGPAAAGLHNRPMSYAPQQHQVGYPQNTPRGRQPAANAPAAWPAPRAPRFAAPRRMAGWVQGIIALILLVLVGSGLGAELLDWVRQLLER